MALCPNCKQEISKRKNGACPLCFTELQTFGGRLYREGDSPNTSILYYFEGLVSKNMTAEQGQKVVFHISKKTAQYRRELVAAENLLEMVDGDLDLVKETLDILFTHRKMSFKFRNSLMSIGRDFNVALALAQSSRLALGTLHEQQNKTLQSIIDKEDIFA